MGGSLNGHSFYLFFGPAARCRGRVQSRLFTVTVTKAFKTQKAFSLYV